MKIRASTGAMLSIRPFFRSTKYAGYDEQATTAENHDPVHDEALDVDVDELEHPDRDPHQHRSTESDEYRVDEDLTGKADEVPSRTTFLQLGPA